MYYYRMARRKYNITRVGKTNRRHDRYRNIKSRNVTRKVQTTQQQINTQQSDFRMKVETIGRIAEQKGYQELSQKELKMYMDYIARRLTKKDIYIMTKYIEAKESSWTYWALYWFIKYLEVSGNIFGEINKYEQLYRLRNAHQGRMNELRKFEEAEKATDLIILKEAPKLEPVIENVLDTNVPLDNNSYTNATQEFMASSISNASRTRNNRITPEKAVYQRANARMTIEDIGTYFGNVSTVSGTPTMSLLAPNEICIKTLGIGKCPYVLLISDYHSELPHQRCNSCNQKNGCLDLRASGPSYTNTPFLKYLNDTVVPKDMHVTVLTESATEPSSSGLRNNLVNNPKKSALHQVGAIGKRCKFSKNGNIDMKCEFPNINFEGVDVRQDVDSMTNSDAISTKLQTFINTPMSKIKGISHGILDLDLQLSSGDESLSFDDSIDLYMKFFNRDTTMGDMFRDELYQRSSITYQQLKELDRTSPGAMNILLDQVENEPTIPMTEVHGYGLADHSFPYDIVQEFLQAIKNRDVHIVKEMIENRDTNGLGDVGFRKKHFILNMATKNVDLVATAKALQKNNGEIVIIYAGKAHTNNIQKMLSGYYNTHYNWARGVKTWFFSSAKYKCVTKN
jgi:hypothetical protein